MYKITISKVSSSLLHKGNKVTAGTKESICNELPFEDKENLSFKGALAKFLAVFVAKCLSWLSKTDDKTCALISEEYLFTGLRKGCGFLGLNKKQITSLTLLTLISQMKGKWGSIPWIFIS